MGCGTRISANQHLGCFVGSLTVQMCASNRGKCKHCAAKFVKGGLRFGYASSQDDVGYLCLEGAASLLPKITSEVDGWETSALVGFEELQSQVLKAEVHRAVCSGGLAEIRNAAF